MADVKTAEMKKAEVTKGEVLEQTWVRLMKGRALAYPYPPFGHHPNFKGASGAGKKLVAALLVEGLLTPGDAALSYPDYVLRGARKGLLEAGIRVLVPAKYGKGYRLLDPSRVKPAQASTIAGAEKVGEATAELPPLKLVLMACVALSERGEILTKGYGFSVPEEALSLPRFSLAHPLQIREVLPATDGQLSAYATPDSVCWLK